MNKENYVLAEELISADEARIKTEAVQLGLMADLQKMNKAIKDNVALGRPSIRVFNISETMIDILRGRGHSVNIVGDGMAVSNAYIVSWL